jgi:hypothetical protein
MEPYVEEIASVLAAAGPEIEDVGQMLGTAAAAYLAERAQMMGDEVSEEDVRELLAAIAGSLSSSG